MTLDDKIDDLLREIDTKFGVVVERKIYTKRRQSYQTTNDSSVSVFFLPGMHVVRMPVNGPALMNHHFFRFDGTDADKRGVITALEALTNVELGPCPDDCACATYFAKFSQSIAPTEP